MKERYSAAAIDQHADELIALATKIWENPEMGWTEKQASQWTADYLREQGFEVELGAYGMPTAIRAVWGHGHPVIGFCAEYDCLPGLSQKVCAHQDPVVPGGLGQGCGHNLLGVGCVGAVIGLKAELEQSGKEGTVVFYGCPGEEQLIGKGLMAKAGAFTECDFTIAWHPGTSNDSLTGVCNGVEAAIFRFKGRTSHAAANPQDGRSALDAAQLMNIGVEFLREHVSSDVRMHYIYMDGGLAPNIVPEAAATKYFVRAQSREAVVDAFQRVINCAEGAAKMTDTTLEIERLGGIYPTLQNKVLNNLMQEVREQLPPLTYTEEELAFADEMNSHSPRYVKGVTPPIDSEIRPLQNGLMGGSTDYGDVMHIRPGVQMTICTAATLSGGHSWMITSCSGSSIGMKGMLYAAKVMAEGAYRVIEQPEMMEAINADFEQSTGGKPYICPITDDVAWPYKD